MKDFVKALLAAEAPEAAAVVDLCLDWSLLKDEIPGRFQRMSGLDSFPELEILSVQGHSLRSCNGLPALAQLHSLNLSQNEIQDLSDFPPLPALRFLDLSLNELRHIDDLPSLPHLQELHLSHNQVTELRDIAPLPQLQVLYLTGNRRFEGGLTRTSLPNLHSLYAKDCPLNPGAIKSMCNMRKVVYSPAAPLFTVILIGIDHLEELGLYMKRIFGDIDLPSMRGLTHLAIHQGHYISAVRGWEELPKLTHLDLRDFAPEASFPGLANAVHLQHIELHNVPGIDWKQLEALPDLQAIGLRGKVNAEGMQSFQKVRKEVEITFR